MARTLIDAHRSLARYISETLGDEWDVWSLRVEAQENRSYAVVKPVQVPQIVAGSNRVVDVSQPFIVYMYPEVAPTVLEGQQQKLQVEEALWNAFYIQHSLRIPFYDYTTGAEDGTAIPLDQPGPPLPMVTAVYANGSPAGHDYLRVREYRISSAQDTTDERRWTITLTLRLAWRRRGQLVSGPSISGATVSPASNASS